MKTIPCNLSLFTVDPTIHDPQDQMLEHARSIVRYLREHINQHKSSLDERISESAAFVVFEQNLSELVHNTLDAFRLQQHKKNKFILIAIPSKLIPNTPVTLIYCDNAGGFSKDFLHGKQRIDYYQEKMQNHELTVSSNKQYSSLRLFGGQGFALSQICRFLHKHAGTLTIGNTAIGAKILISSPVKNEYQMKPSFHRFAVHVDSADIIAEYEKQANAPFNKNIELATLSPTEPIEQAQENSGKKNKFGLRLQVS